MSAAAKVLYFPYINAPQDAWFTRVLLYWDKVGSIVPADYARSGDRYTPYMRELLDAELVERVTPEDHVEPLIKPMESFLQELDHDAEVAARSGRPLGIEAATRGGVESGTVIEIHQGKLGHIVGHGLMERGLARRAPRGRGDWYQVDSFVGARFMSFLAASLGARVDMWPITDTAYGLIGFAGAPPSGTGRRAIVEELRPAILDAVLPAPAEPVSTAELVDFKAKHGQLLTHFRREVDQRLIEISREPDEWARTQLQNNAIADAEEQVDEIVARMRERRWRRVGKGALLIAGPAAATAASIATLNPVTGIPAAATFAATIYRVRNELRPSVDWREEPLAYAALAQRRFATATSPGRA
jgi:hypothetical protein